MLSATRWAFARAVLSSETDEIKEKDARGRLFLWALPAAEIAGGLSPPTAA